MYERILVPIDGSETSMAGLREAVKLAAALHSQVRILHVVNEFILDYSYGAAMYANNLIESLRETGKHIVQQGEKIAREHGVSVEGVLVESIGEAAASLILTQARDWDANLIVMGTHGRRGLRRIVLGSDAENVVRQSPQPVLLVHGEAASLGPKA